MVLADENRYGRLQALVSEVNEAEDSIAAKIRTLEKRLAPLKIRFPVWTLILVCETPKRAESNENWMGLVWEAWQLGYCKVGDSWCIATRKVEASLEAEYPKHATSTEAISEPIALINSPRIVRHEAQLRGRLEEFEEALEEALASLVQKLNR